DWSSDVCSSDLERRTGFAERTVAGFEAAAAERGVHATLHPCAPETASKVAKALLRDRPDLSGLIVHNESSLLWLLDAFADQGRTPPDPETAVIGPLPAGDRKSTRLNSSHVSISYAVFCLKK